MPRNLFWNVVGTAGLGFCSFVLTLNLRFFPWIVAGELAQGYHIRALLSNDYLTPYGFFNIVASGVACFLIVKRATARNVMGYPQIAIVVVAASVLVLWSRLAYGDRPLRWEERGMGGSGAPVRPCERAGTPCRLKTADQQRLNPGTQPGMNVKSVVLAGAVFGSDRFSGICTIPCAASHQARNKHVVAE